MRFAKTRFVLLCMVLCVLFVLTGCGDDQAPATKGATADLSPQGTSIDGLKRAGTLCVGVRSSSTAPFVVDSSGALSGMDIDLGNSLANELGLPVEFITIDDVAKALQESCDVVINVTSSEAQGFDVVGDYAETAHAFFHKGKPEVVSADAINGRTIAVQDGSSAQMALRVTALTIYESPTSTLNEAFDALHKGTTDYVLCNASSGAYLSSWEDEVSYAGLLDSPIAQGIALQSGEGAVQTAVRGAYDRISQNGVLAEIRRCWLGNLPKLTAESVIQNIPMREATGEALQPVVGSEEIVNNVQNGSTAGANAVSPSEARAMGAQSTGSTSTQPSSQTPQNAPAYTDYTGGTGSAVENYGGTGDTYGGGYTDYGYSGVYAESYEY